MTRNRTRADWERTSRSLTAERRPGRRSSRNRLRKTAGLPARDATTGMEPAPAPETVDPLPVTADTDIRTALTRLARIGITSMPVVDEEQHLCGVVSEADLSRDAVADDPRAHERPITIRPVSGSTTVNSSPP